MRKDVRRRIAAVAAAGALASAPAAWSRTERRSYDRQVSIERIHPQGECAQGASTAGCPQPDSQTEPSLAANPNDPRNVVSAFQVGRYDNGGAAAIGYAATFDGGRSWKDGLLPGLTRANGGAFDRASDPSVGFGPHGEAYVVCLALDATATTATRSALAFFASPDGGRTWRAPVLVQDVNTNVAPQRLYGLAVDQSWIAVDTHTAAGHHRGRIYVMWIRREPGAQGSAFAAYSDDNGAAWQTGPGGAGFLAIPAGAFKPWPMVLRNGDLAVMSLTQDPASLAAAAQSAQPNRLQTEAEPITVTIARGAGAVPTGGTLSFDRPQRVAADYGNGDAGQSGCGGVAAAVDRAGRLVLAWTDTRFRSNALNDIVVTTSPDEGATWSPIVRVNSDPVENLVNRCGAMVTTSSDGRIIVGARRRQAAAGDPGDGSTYGRRIDTVIATSTDDGRTFGPETVVNSSPSDLGFATVNSNSVVIGTSVGPFLGDYAQMTSSGRSVYIARAEPVRASGTEPSTMPPTFHHQRIWVAAR